MRKAAGISHGLAGASRDRIKQFCGYQRLCSCMQALAGAGVSVDASSVEGLLEQLSLALRPTLGRREQR